MWVVPIATSKMQWQMTMQCLRVLLGAPSIIAGAPSTYCEKSQMPLLFFKKKAVHPTTLSSSFSASLFSFILLPFLRAFLLLLLSSSSLFNFFLPPSSFFREPISTSFCSSVLHRGKLPLFLFLFVIACIVASIVASTVAGHGVNGKLLCILYGSPDP